MQMKIAVCIKQVPVEADPVTGTLQFEKFFCFSLFFV